MSSQTHQVIITAGCKSYGGVFNSVTVINDTPVNPKALLQYSPTCPDGSGEKLAVPGMVMLVTVGLCVPNEAC